MFTTEKLKEIQARSGLHFAFFLVMHLACHYSLAFGSIERSNFFLQVFRKLYQHRLFESLMLISVLAHMYSNVALYLVRNNMAPSEREETSKEGSTERTAHRIAGYILGLSLIGHVAAVRIGPLWLLENPSDFNYYFVVKANQLYGKAFLIYLAIFGMAAGWHLIYGVRSAIATFQGSSVIGKPFPLLLKILAFMNHVGIILAVLALGGYLYPISIEPEEEETINNYWNAVMSKFQSPNAEEL